MYRVMLVDDDSIARMRLKNLLQWEKINCQIVGEASSGREAVAQIERCRPHIVITDIDMPGMNGVDLIQYTRAKHPNIYILALSAYDDFDYVRDSLKYGALDYMLKHQLTPRKLETALQEAFANIDESAGNGSTERQDTERGLLGRLLRELPDGRERPGISLERAADRTSGRENEKRGEGRRIRKESGPEGRGIREMIPERYRGDGFFLAAGLLPPSQQGSGEKKLRYLQGIISETLSQYDWEACWEIYQDSLVFLFPAEDGLTRKDVTEVLDQAAQNAKRYTGMAIEFEASAFYSDLMQTGQIYRSLLSEEWKRGGSGEPEENGLMLKLEETRELEQSLQERNLEHIRQCLDSLFDRMERNGGTQVQISIAAAELCNILQRRIQEQNQGRPAGRGEDSAQERMRPLADRIGEALKDIQKERDIGAVHEMVAELYEDFIQRAAKEEKISYGNPLVNESIAWIQERWDQPISLRDVADALSVNSAYLSRLFRKYTGKTIVTFINELKMERAKEMIEAGELSLKEISLSLGFQNYNYFYRLFKEVYGISPSDL